MTDHLRALADAILNLHHAVAVMGPDFELQAVSISDKASGHLFDATMRASDTFRAYMVGSVPTYTREIMGVRVEIVPPKEGGSPLQPREVLTAKQVLDRFGKT